MATVLSIYNDALSILGKQSLSDPDLANESQRVLADNYPRMVKTVFEEADWNCAIERVELAQLSIAPAFGYQYFYKLPTACLRIIQVSDTGDEKTPFEAWKEERGRIATDASTLYLWYILATVIDTPGAWTNHLAGYAAADLAMRCAPRIAPDALGSAEKERSRRRKHALQNDARSAPPKRHTPGAWARSRMGGIRFNPEMGR